MTDWTLSERQIFLWLGQLSVDPSLGRVVHSADGMTSTYEQIGKHVSFSPQGRDPVPNVNGQRKTPNETIQYSGSDVSAQRVPARQKFFEHEQRQQFSFSWGGTVRRRWKHGRRETDDRRPERN